jgi:hypothetical protein
MSNKTIPFGDDDSDVRLGINIRLYGSTAYTSKLRILFSVAAGAISK